MMQRSQSTDAPPLHVQISEKLRTQIHDGDYAPGDQLPSEFDLGQEFGVSRTTIRRAIANLVHQGLVSTRQGKGAFVCHQEKIVFSLSNLLTFFDADRYTQISHGNLQILASECKSPPPDIYLHLQLPNHPMSVYSQKTLILANQRPIALDQVYCSLAIEPHLDSDFLSEFPQRLLHTLLDRHGIPVLRLQITLESVRASPELSTYLHLPIGTPLAVHRYIGYSTGDRPVICGYTYSSADRTCYSMEFQRNCPNPEPMCNVAKYPWQLYPSKTEDMVLPIILQR